jgi:hypothetical protein
MTEQEWDGEANPYRMTGLVESKGSSRKIRLFACACLRQVWQTLDCERDVIRAAVVVCERLAEGMQTSDETASLFAQLEQLSYRYKTRTGPFPDDLAQCLISDDTSHLLESSLSASEFFGSLPSGGRAAQSDLVRDIFGNPFQPYALVPSAQTDDVVTLARAAYDERHLPSGELDPHRLAVLADALEEAGAPDEMVAHLRGPGPHVRGCHVIDACLGLT